MSTTAVHYLLSSTAGLTAKTSLRAAYEKLLQEQSGKAAQCTFISVQESNAELKKLGLTYDQLMTGKKIAIVGAGIAGLNAAFTLLEGYRDLDDQDQNHITIFEANSEEGKWYASCMRVSGAASLATVALLDEALHFVH
jgi:hypothetical protein